MAIQYSECRDDRFQRFEAIRPNEVGVPLYDRVNRTRAFFHEGDAVFENVRRFFAIVDGYRRHVIGATRYNRHFAGNTATSKELPPIVGVDDLGRVHHLNLNSADFTRKETFGQRVAAKVRSNVDPEHVIQRPNSGGAVGCNYIDAAVLSISMNNYLLCVRQLLKRLEYSRVK
jgi:hypothetical protein